MLGIKHGRKHPRLSANQLAAYHEATSALKRRRILEEAKYPQDAMVIYYDEPCKILRQFYAKGFDAVYLEEALEKYKEKDTDSEWAEIRKNACIKLLEVVLNEERSPLERFKILPYSEKGNYIRLAEVEISVCPDLIVSKIVSGETKVGAIKFVISKGEPKLSPKGQQIVSLLLYRYVKSYVIGEDEIPHKKYCFSFDPYRQAVGESSPAVAQLSKDLEETCKEIAERWDKV